MKGGSLNGLGSGGQVPCPPSTCTGSRGGSHHPSPGRAGGQGTGSDVLLPRPARLSSACDPPTSDQAGPVHPAPRQPAPELQACKPPLSGTRSPSPAPGPPGLPELGGHHPWGAGHPAISPTHDGTDTPGFHEDQIIFLPAQHSTFPDQLAGGAGR